MKKSKIKTYTFRGRYNPMLLPVLTIGILLILAYLVSSAVLTSQVSIDSLARTTVKGCNLSCSSDKECATGTTCVKANPTDRKGVCQCGYGTNCIIGEKAVRTCIAPLGKAKEFEYCDQKQTVKANRGDTTAALTLACGYGVECKHVVRRAGGSYFMCCDPKNPSKDPRCISDNIRIVAPRP